jgi:hypothetical protein
VGQGADGKSDITEASRGKVRSAKDRDAESEQRQQRYAEHVSSSNMGQAKYRDNEGSMRFVRAVHRVEL